MVMEEEQGSKRIRKVLLEKGADALGTTYRILGQPRVDITTFKGPS